MGYDSVRASSEQESNIIMTNMLNAVPCGIGIFIFGKTLGCEYYSDGFTRMAGITRAEMDQKLEDNTVLSSIIAPIDFPQVAPILMETTAKGLPLNMTYRYIYGDGSIRWLHLTGEKMGERDGYPAYYCVFTTPTEETALYRNITEDSANGVAVFNYDSREVLYINNAAIHFYGLSNPSETVGKSFFDVLEERNLPMILTEKQIESLVAEKYTMFHVKHQSQYLAVKGKRLKWGNIDACILYITDETAEREKEIHLEKLLNQIPTGIATYRVDQNEVDQTFMNDGFYHIFGVTKEEYEPFSGVHSFDAVAKEDKPFIAKIVQKLRAGANHCDFIYRSELPNHNRIWIRLVGAVADRDENGFFLYAGFTDVTEQILIQNRQKELFDTIPSGIMEFFFDGKSVKVLSANQTLIDMIGVTQEEFDSRDYWILNNVVHPEDYHLLVEAQEGVKLGKGKTYDFRLLNRRTGVYRWVSCDFTITERTSEGIKVISAFLDVDDKRKAEDASAAKSRFLSRMSHEIRTPINAIMGIAELEKQDFESKCVYAENIEKYYKETFAASNYLLTLVNDILDTSRIENNQIEIKQHPVVVEQYLADVQTLIEPLAKEKNIHFIFKRATRMHEVYIGDGVRVKQIIVNLLNNAFKFTPPNGTVRLTCESIAETQEKATLQFTVADNGIGMSKEFQEKLFTPFVQENSDTTSPFTGSGLGLSIARNLAQKMGGDITCQSEKGKGSTFTVTIVVGIPDKEEEKERTKEENPMNADFIFEGVRILVCEDHPLNQKITRALLERKKCQVEIAADGAIGVDRFAKSPIGYYSMVLMDIRMPNMDGLEATRQIRKLNRADASSVPIVAMSANAYDEDVKKSLAAGMNDHMAKPVDAAKLYSSIAHYTIQTEVDNDDRQSILIVDDIEVNRIVIAEALRSDYLVLEAENGLQGLQILEHNKSIIGVVIDIQMPVMNGIDFIKNVRRQFQYEDIGILVNTQFGDAEQQKELLALGADDFVYKPTSPTILAIRLKNVLARRKHIL